MSQRMTAQSSQEKARPSHLLTHDALTEVCVCFSYIGARGKNQTSLRRPGGRLVEDLGLPAASSVLHSLRQHGEEQRNKKISHLTDCDLYICPHWDSAAAGNSRDTMLNF